MSLPGSQRQGRGEAAAPGEIGTGQKTRSQSRMARGYCKTRRPKILAPEGWEPVAL